MNGKRVEKKRNRDLDQVRETMVAADLGLADLVVLLTQYVDLLASRHDRHALDLASLAARTERNEADIESIRSR